MANSSSLSTGKFPPRLQKIVNSSIVADLLKKCYRKNVAKGKISPKYRQKLSEKLMDLGNYVAVGLVIGQFVEGKFSVERLVAGIIGTLSCYFVSYLLEH